MQKMIRMNEKDSIMTAKQVLAVIIALILMMAFLPARPAGAEEESFLEIEDIDWDSAFVILDDPIYFMGDEDMEVPVITSAGKTNVKVNGAWTRGSVYVKVNGQWVESKKIYVKVNGNWVEGS